MPKDRSCLAVAASTADARHNKWGRVMAGRASVSNTAAMPALAILVWDGTGRNSDELAEHIVCPAILTVVFFPISPCVTLPLVGYVARNTHRPRHRLSKVPHEQLLTPVQSMGAPHGASLDNVCRGSAALIPDVRLCLPE